MVFSEDCAEMTGVVIAQLLSDIGDGTLRMVQEMFRLFHFFLGDDLGKRTSSIFFDDTA